MSLEEPALLVIFLAIFALVALTSDCKLNLSGQSLLMAIALLYHGDDGFPKLVAIIKILSSRTF